MMSVVSAESSSTVHVLHANTPATTVHCVSCPSHIEPSLLSVENEHSDWQMRTLVSYGMNLVSGFTKALNDDG